MYCKKLMCLFGLIASVAFAHGDGAEHSHASANLPSQQAKVLPVMSAVSESFELVARLYDDELSVYVDQWASNTPVLNAQIEVELNGKKAVAKFHADHGDYSVTDTALLKSLHAVGEHPLLFTITTDKDADLLTGALHVEADASMAGLASNHLFIWLSAGLVLLAALLLGRRWYLRKGVTR